VYVDARKFDYSKFYCDDAEGLAERDKAAARDTYCQWMHENVGMIVERQWEIDDIGAVEQTGEFIKLLKEAEFAYAIGAYTSVIALIGVCAEDLCRFFANSAGHNLDSETQANRTDCLRQRGVITQNIADKFHFIRRLRNDCLHYNDGFKQKDTARLKADALETLNTIKAIYAEIVGVIDYRTINVSTFNDICNAIAHEAAGSNPGELGIDAAVSRTRNLFASVFSIDLSLGNSGSPVYSTSIFKVVEIDTDIEPVEITLANLDASKMPVIVDLTDKEADEIRAEGIKSSDLVVASLISLPNKLGMSGTWRLCSPIRKLA